MLSKLIEPSRPQLFGYLDAYKQRLSVLARSCSLKWKEDQADMEAFNLFDTVKDDPEKIVDDHCPNTTVGFQSTGEGGSIIPPPIGGLLSRS